jgi:hypothetical protein
VQRVHRVDTSLSVEKSQRRDSARSVQVTFSSPKSQETFLSPKLRREVQSVRQV